MNILELNQNLKEETVEKLKLNCQDEGESWDNLAEIVNEAVYDKMGRLNVLVSGFDEKEYLRETLAIVLAEKEVCEEDIETIVDFICEKTDLPTEIENRIEEIVEFLLGEYLETVEDLDDREKVVEGLENWLNTYFKGEFSELYEEFIQSYFEDKIDEGIEWEKENR